MATAEKGDPSLDLVCQCLLRRSGLTVGGNAAVEGTTGKGGGAGGKIAEHVGEVFADIGAETPYVEIDVGALRCIGDQPPAPQVGRQCIQRRVREHAATLAR